ncbi:hypothetical protein C8F04DRAFT_1117462 [Mycena alexandri]|uniref:Uncharacterized protein n=1 Tax=Mycena alexandri TaxID=1745969 RepID=A0AAD6WVM9_9AGAR|nr:hypothetical protein C8F04DRAFT_177584 [Mycena alexandri]KAJ7029078.1 hypothetical protein C8F04DRAFT_1117462 [Mycena alexandri]
MAKKNEKQKAAANREASKRNKAIPFPPPRDLSFGTVTTDNIRRYFRHCYRYMDAYRMGLNLRQAAYAVKE